MADRKAKKPTTKEIKFLKDFVDGKKQKEKMKKGEYDPMTGRYMLTKAEINTIMNAIDYCLEKIAELTV